MAEGLFLSRGAYEKAENLFADYLSVSQNCSIQKPKRAKIETLYTEDITSIDWSDFEAVYLSLYKYNLYGCVATNSRKLDNIRGMDKCVQLHLLIDRSLPEINKETTFEESLISESLVVDLMKLKNRVEQLIPYPTRLTSFGSGCIFLEFSVYGRNKNENKELPGLEKDFIKSSKAWNMIRDRFDVSEFELNSF